MTTVATKTNIQLTGVDIKKIKAMVKGHRHNKNHAILNYVMFKVENNKLTIERYDNNHTLIQLTFETDAYNTTFLFPIDILKKLSITKNSIHQFNALDSFTVEHVEKGISQKYNVVDHEKFWKHSYSDRDFDEIATLDDKTFNKLSIATLSTSKSEARPSLQTVQIKSHGEIYSTDSRRLFGSKASLDMTQDIIIPSYTIKLIDSFKDKKDTVTIGKYSDILKLYNKNFTIFVDVKMYENFPDVSGIIPQDFNETITIVEYSKFKKALELIKKADKKNPVTTCVFDYNNNKVTVKHEGIEADINITVDTNSQKEMETILFNATYMLDTMRQIDSKQIRIKFVSNMKPFVVDSMENNESLILILPTRSY